ncbi:MAG: hypothetical protein JRJ19_12620 [Deltaproteobacteria bacterium]|nr:hypothetical protein [Deltaproteobacteria bacterium]
MSPKAFFGILGLVLLIANCSSSQSIQDGGPDADGIDGADANADPGADKGSDIGQCEPGVFCLILEPGAKACSVFMDDREWQKELAVLGRIHFYPGVVTLPTDQATFEGTLIETVEYGPERVAATHQGAGFFEYEYHQGGIPSQGSHIYRYRQEFDLEGQAYAIEFQFEFGVNDGVPYYYEIRLNDDFAEYRTPIGILGDGSLYPDQYQHFSQCHYRDIPLFIATTTAENGDQAIVHKRFLEPGGGSGPANLVYAEITVDGTIRTTEDYFELVYAAYHHNFDETYLVLLKPPVGDVHAILFEHVWYYQGPTDMIYLDAEMTELRRSPLTAWEEVEQ